VNAAATGAELGCDEWGNFVSENLAELTFFGRSPLDVGTDSGQQSWDAGRGGMCRGFRASAGYKSSTGNRDWEMAMPAEAKGELREVHRFHIDKLQNGGADWLSEAATATVAGCRHQVRLCPRGRR
jgi:hypothetical protein